MFTLTLTKARTGHDSPAAFLAESVQLAKESVGYP
tara:strand:+ start:377 stop:481 length:105 start_codon:yes stop_codon:yes gene_type:complete